MFELHFMRRYWSQLLAACVMLAVAATPAQAQVSVLPNPQLHPGAVDPAVTQANIQSTICTSGYTAKVRPSSSYTTALKKQQMAAEGLPGTAANYEEDHVIPLEVGGAPSAPENLSPEAYERSGLVSKGAGSETKDRVENKTHDLVCSGQMTLAYAQLEIAKNWYVLGKSEGVI